jgi:Leucine-rich repeat (LRR) protein
MNHVLLGSDFFGTVYSIDLEGANGRSVNDVDLKPLKDWVRLGLDDVAPFKENDAGLELLRACAELDDLRPDGSQLTDSGLEHLKGLTELKGLDVSRTGITDGGLQVLNGLTRLEYLRLVSTQVTDVGLENLKGLTNLQGLWLSDTLMTDTGVFNLQKALPNCQITR